MTMAPQAIGALIFRLIVFTVAGTIAAVFPPDPRVAVGFFLGGWFLARMVYR